MASDINAIYIFQKIWVFKLYTSELGFSFCLLEYMGENTRIYLIIVALMRILLHIKKHKLELFWTIIITNVCDCIDFSDNNTKQVRPLLSNIKNICQAILSYFDNLKLHGKRPSKIELLPNTVLDTQMGWWGRLNKEQVLPA